MYTYKRILLSSILLFITTFLFSQTGASDVCLGIYAVRPMLIDAIEKGAPVYNEGNHKKCYKIYRKTSKKVLKEFGAQCPNITILLGAARAKARYFDKNDTERAWTMRIAFDNILGVETKTAEL